MGRGSCRNFIIGLTVRLILAAVGHAKSGPERTLFEHYQSRLSQPLTVHEVEEKRPLPIADRILREGTLLLAQVPQHAVVIALDERGQTLSSEQFAKRLGTWRDTGCKSIAFLIGGADGHAPIVKERADFLLSLGIMTWPHMLVRGMLAEQLYRVECILAGHPYHRGPSSFW